MAPKITLSSKPSATENNVFIFGKKDPIQIDYAPVWVNEHLQKEIAGGQSMAFFQDKKNLIAVCVLDLEGKSYEVLEKARKSGHAMNRMLNSRKIKSVTLVHQSKAELALPFAEGLVLSNYQFLKYFKNVADKTYSLQDIKLISKNTKQSELEQLNILNEAAYQSRNLVNEPLSYLTAEQLSKEIVRMGKESGFKVTVHDIRSIKKMGMGGILNVNRGSILPPTFNVLEYKAAKAKNSKPIVLVGKGIVYDTGGLSLKPTPNSMDLMKCDMAGAAAVAGAFYAIAKAKLPLHVIGLIPATENRPGENAYTPGDVITIHNGMTVEVLNTDAEGRLVLADALSYAQQYKPELCIDLATLTGSAKAAVGSVCSVMMGTADEKVKTHLKQSGYQVCERLAEFPFYDDYAEFVKSDIADLKNVGGPDAGAITAGKFLEKFTNYPWLHLDIAGTAYVTTEQSYKGKYATAVGLRLLFEFLKTY